MNEDADLVRLMQIEALGRVEEPEEVDPSG